MRLAQHTTTAAAKKVKKQNQVAKDWGYREDIFLELIDLLLEIRGEDLRYTADQAGVHISTLYKWVDGGTMCPRIDTLCRVARALGYRITLQALH